MSRHSTSNSSQMCSFPFLLRGLTILWVTSATHPNTHRFSKDLCSSFAYVLLEIPALPQSMLYASPAWNCLQLRAASQEKGKPCSDTTSQTEYLHFAPGVPHTVRWRPATRNITVPICWVRQIALWDARDPTEIRLKSNFFTFFFSYWPLCQCSSHENKPKIPTPHVTALMQESVEFKGPQQKHQV